MLRLISIEPSDRKNKKYKATFSDGKVTHFGDSNYEDYTQHKDNVRKLRYIQRHQKDKLDDPTSAGALSMFLLWNKLTLIESIEDYRQRFNV